MKKILLIGGLGYLGSHLNVQLEQNSEYEVTIYDVNFFNSNYMPAKSELINKNFISCTEEEFEVFDLIVICSNIDVEEFYSCGLYNKYAGEYVETFKKLTNLVDTEILYFVTHTENLNSTDTYYIKHLKRIHKVIESNINDNITIYECPELYGGQFKIRDDCFVNNIITDLIINKQYLLQGDIIKTIMFTHIHKFIKSIVSLIKDMLTEEEVELELYYVNKLPKFYIANLLEWMLGDGYHVYMQPNLNIDLSIQQNLVFTESEQFTYTINQFNTIYKDINSVDIIKNLYNNKLIIESAISGKNFNNNFD